MYKKNDVIKLDINDLTDEGLGIARYDGQVFFVKGALPFDKVEAIITKITPNIIFAKTINIIEKSKYRIKTKCKNADSCGGCQLIELDYNYQLDFKKKLVLNKIKKLGGIDVSSYYDEMIAISVPYHFRNKMQVPFSINKNNEIIYGFYAGRTHCIVPFNYCFVGFSGAELILNIIKNALIEFNISIYNEENHTGIFREVYLRCGNNSNEVSLAYIINDDEYDKKINFYKKFDEKVRNNYKNIKNIEYKKNEIITTALNINTSNNNVILGKRNYILYGSGYINDSIGDILYRVSIESFYQVNIEMTHKLYDKIVEYGEFSKNERVLDLFSGIGTISLYIAKYVISVTGIEIVRKAVEDAIENAKINNITNVNFICADLNNEKFGIDISKVIYDIVIVDPPRKGLDISIINFINMILPKKLIYVSCDPATLARDLKILSNNNYKIIKISNVDMFPHTTHVETICLMLRYL